MNGLIKILLIKKMRNIRINKKLLLICMLPLLLASCYAEIEPSAANSTSAIIAVIGEYVLAVLFLIICFVIHLLRIGGSAISTIALYSIYCERDLWMFDPVLLLIIGIVMIACSLFFPANLYTPQVIIANNISKYRYKYKRKNEKKKDNKTSVVYEIIIGVIIGVITEVILIAIK